MKKQLLLFILTLLPMLAMADDSGSCGTNVTYTFVSSTGTLTIQGSGAMEDYSLYSPAWWGYSYRTNIKTVIIKEGVTSIGNYAFEGCTGLTSVTIPNSVTSIGNYAFYGCYRLTSVTIPNSVTSIGYDAFEDCSGLTSITIPNSVTSIGYDAFKGSPWWTNYSADPANQYGNIIYINDIAYKAINTSITSCEFKEGTIGIGGYAFENCSGLTSVTIPNSVTSIGSYAFEGCSGLQKVIVPDIAAWCGISFYYKSNPLYYAHHIYSDENTEIKDLVIPDGVTSIRNHAFEGCSGLTSVTIGNSVTSIGSYAFNGCSSLTSITIPNSVTSIGSEAFYGCSGLCSVEFHCAQIGSWFSGKNSIKEVIIGNEVTGIGYQAFKGCSGLTSITIPNSVTSIGAEAFYNCSGLTSVNIPNSVTSIGYDAFYGCSGLTSVTIGNSVTSVGNYAFSGCSSLTSVEFHCAQIGSWFSGMTSIKEVIIGNEVTSIGASVFSGCSGLTSVTIGNSVTSIGNGAFSGCTGLQKVIVPDIAAWCGISFGDNPLYYAHHIYSDENTEIKELIIPDGVTSIGNFAFINCSNLTSVTIPNSVTSVGNYAFSGCSSLTSVTIGNSVTSIGSRAFWSCLGLQKVIVPDIAAWCAISFANNSDNPLYYAHHIYSDKNTEITEIVIPEGVNIIGQYAFYNCENITSVIIPSSVTSIGKNAFSCGIKLSTVNVNMNIPIEIDESVFEFTGENYSKDIIYLAATLNVPIGSKALYSNVKGWKKFMNINVVDFTPKHKLVYVVDGVEYKVYEIAEGATITPEPTPTKEGYTFSGWSEIPETMPAHDVTVTGTFSINKYKLTYMVDGVEYKRYELEYGAEITPEPTPTKEGYTFSGWSEIPETMPAHDVTVTGSFAVNQYLITYMIGDEVYQKKYVDYGATIVLPNVPEREGYSFAWIDAPEKMPAHDITINGAYTSGIWGVSNDDATTNTYTIGGYKTDKPRRGVNIVRMSDGTTRKVVVK